MIRTLFPKPRKPYFIVAPTLAEKSAGVKALHHLCHALNSSGERAYLIAMNRAAYVTDMDLLTPICTNETVEAYDRKGVDPIVVYPDIVRGNPMEAKNVVRYLLHYAGAYGGDREFPATDKIWCYSKGVADDIGSKNIMFMLTADPSLFYPPKVDERSGTAFYARKYTGDIIPEYSGTRITADWPDNRNELADLLRRSERLYVYEDTALASEALMCGCPVTHVLTPYFQKGHSESELSELINGNPLEAVAHITERFWQQLDNFIEDTQKQF